MDTIVGPGPGRSVGEAGPPGAPWWISGRARAEAERRTIGRRRTPDLLPAARGCPSCGTARVIASPGAREACGSPNAVLPSG